MRSTVEQRSGCPISIALELIGDPWSLLVVRDLMFTNRRTFNAIRAGEERIASNILADRLARLEGGGIVERRRDPTDARRVEYRLTEKGIALAPVLVELILWSDAHHETEAPPEIVHRMKTQRGRFLKQLRNAWERSTG